MHSTIITALERIAAREGCNPEDLPPLYQSVDAEALTRVLESQPEIQVSFNYASYRVTVKPGHVDVTERTSQNQERH